LGRIPGDALPREERVAKLVLRVGLALLSAGAQVGEASGGFCLCRQVNKGEQRQGEGEEKGNHLLIWRFGDLLI